MHVFSQSIYIGKNENIKCAALDSINNKIIVFFDGYYKKVDLATMESDSTKIYSAHPFSYSNFKPLLLHGIPYFVNKSGGLLYVLSHDTIKRIDNSFDHKMQSQSHIFAYHSKIYKYGGYGFWSARNFFTYFSKKFSEWFVVNPIYSKDQPIGSFGGFSKLINNEFYIFAGRTIDPNDRIGDTYFNEVWKFNLATKKWYYLGTNDGYTYDFNFKTINYQNAIIVLTASQIHVIDILHNTLTKYNRGQSSLNIATFLHSYFAAGKFYIFTGKNDKLFLTAVVPNRFFGDKLSVEPFYNNHTLLKNVLGLLLGLVLLIALSFYIKIALKKRRKIVLLDNGLRFKNKFAEFDAKSMQIIQLLLTSKAINSNKILTIVEEPQYSVAHNERLKVQKIDEINFKLKTLLGINTDVIFSEKSKEDKRVRVYSISQHYFFN